MNEINASERRRIAAKNEGEAEKIKRVLTILIKAYFETLMSF